MQQQQNQLSSLLLQQQHQINYQPQPVDTDINVNAVICARCQCIPTDYICLSCGDNFCLQCIGLSVLRGEGEAVLVNGNQAISISCYVCGQPTQLTQQATSAIDDFLQALDQKILMKNMAFQQTQGNFINNDRNSTTNFNSAEVPNFIQCASEIQNNNIPISQGFLFEQHLKRQQLEQQKQLDYLSEARAQRGQYQQQQLQQEDYNFQMENDNNFNNISHCRQSTNESIQDSVQQQEMVVFPWSENQTVQQTTSQQFPQIPSAIASSSSSSSTASIQPNQQQINFDTLGAQQIISNIQLIDQPSQQSQQNYMNQQPQQIQQLCPQQQGGQRNLARKIYSSKSSTAVCGNSNLSALNDRRKAIIAENSLKQHVVLEEEDVSVDEKLPSTHYTTTTNANSVSQLQLFINNNNNNNTNINNNMQQSQSQQHQRSKQEPCEVLMCEQHPLKQGILFCFECDSEPFCLDCLNEGFHKSHDVILIEGNFHKLAGKMKETAHEIRASVEILKAQESRLEQMNQSCERDAKIVSAMIKQEIAAARESLRKKEVNLMEKTEQLLLERSAKIQGKLSTIETKTQALNELSNQFQLISSMDEPSLQQEKMHLFKFYAQSKHILQQIPLEGSDSPSGSDKNKDLNIQNHNESTQQNMEVFQKEDSVQDNIHSSPNYVTETASASKINKNNNIKPKVDMFWTPHQSKEASNFKSPRQFKKTVERSSLFKEKQQQEINSNSNQEMKYVKEVSSPEEKRYKESFQLQSQVKDIQNNDKPNIISNVLKKTTQNQNITSFPDNLAMTSTSTTPSSVASEIKSSFKKQPKPFEQSNLSQSVFFNKLFNPKKNQNNSQFTTSTNFKEAKNYNILSSSSSFHHQNQHNLQDPLQFPSASSKSIQDVLFSNFKTTRQPPIMKTEESQSSSTYRSYSKHIQSPTKSYFDQHHPNLHHKPKWPLLNKTTTLISSTQEPQKKYNFNPFHRSSTTTTHQHSQLSELSTLTDSESKLDGYQLKQQQKCSDNLEFMSPATTTNPFDYPVSLGQSELSKQLRRIFESGKTTPADRRMTVATANASTQRSHQQNEYSHLKFQKQQPNPLQTLQEQNTIFQQHKNKLFIQ